MIKEEKTALRAQIKQKREALNEDYLKEAGEKIADLVIGSELFRQADVIFAYISMPGEPDTKKIIEAAIAAGKTVCVPKCYGKGIMSAFIIRSFDELKPGRMDIPEPEGSGDPVDEKKIELGIIPCISANKAGQRIGHGAGYYDRFFEKTDCVTVCLCFEELLSENIPMGEYDTMMDHVVTEKGFF